MSEKDIQNLILLGFGAFAVYYLFFRKANVATIFPVSTPVAPQLPGVSVTPQIVGSGVSNPTQQATLVNGQWQTGAGGFPTMSPQGFPATTDGTSYDDVLTE